MTEVGGSPPSAGDPRVWYRCDMCMRCWVRRGNDFTWMGYSAALRRLRGQTPL